MWAHYASILRLRLVKQQSDRGPVNSREEPRASARHGTQHEAYGRTCLTFSDLEVRLQVPQDFLCCSRGGFKKSHAEPYRCTMPFKSCDKQPSVLLVHNHSRCWSGQESLTCEPHGMATVPCKTAETATNHTAGRILLPCNSNRWAGREVNLFPELSSVL